MSKNLIIRANIDVLPHRLQYLLGRSLNFEFYEGGLGDKPYTRTTGWRVLPFMVFFNSPTSTYEFQVEGRDPIQVEPGQSLLIPSGTRHRIDCGEGGLLHGVWFHFNYTVLGTVDVMSLLDTPCALDTATTTTLIDMARKLVELYSKVHDNPLWVMTKRKEQGFHFLSAVVRMSQLRNQAIRFINQCERLAPVLTYIGGHLAESLSIDELADRIGLSRSRFHEVFKDLMGLSPIDYVKMQRFRAAQVLLLSTDLSIAEISSLVGHPDQFHFSRSFRATFGRSPRQFRQHVRETLTPE